MRSLATLVGLALFVRPVLAGQVLVVAMQSGPGVDFTSITSAVQAAADGDVVLVKPGAYNEHIGVHGKSIAIVSDVGGPAIVSGRVKIEALPAAASFSMQGVHVLGAAYTTALQISDCAGSVLLEGCKIDGCSGPGLYGAPGSNAASIQNSDAVALIGCEMRGGGGAYYAHTSDPWSGGGDGGFGLGAIQSKVTLHGCVVLGGSGGSCYPGPCWGGIGAPGCWVSMSELHASASRFFGSSGGSGWGPYAQGASGIALSVYGSSTAELIACHTESEFPAGTSPSLGQDASSTVNDLAIAPVELEVNAASQVGVKPLREGEAGAIEVSGASGAFALLLVAPAPGYATSPSWLGTALVGAPLSVLPLGVLGASASASTPFVVPDQGAGIEGTLVRLQAATIDAQGSLQLGAQRLAVLLDAAL